MGVFIVLAAAYMPVYTGYYAHWDDYYLLGGEYFRGMLVQVLRDVHGRPLVAYLVLWYGSILKFEYGNIARFGNVMLLGGIASILFLWLRRNSVSRPYSFLLAVAVFVLPPFQLAVAQIVTGLTVVMPMAIAALAAVAAFGGVSEQPSWRSLLNFHSAAALGLIFVALIVYPPSAMFYWTMVMAALLFGHKGRQAGLVRFLCIYAIPFIAMGVYFLIGRGMTAGKPRPQSQYVFGLTHEPIEKIKWFVAGPLADALAPWHVFPSKLFAAVSGAVVLVAVASAARGSGASDFKKHLPWNVARWLLVASLVPLSMLPNIVSAGDFAPYRTMVALLPTVFLVLYWAVANLSRLFPKGIANPAVTAVLAAAALIGAYRAHENVSYYFAGPSTAEVRYIRDALLDSDLRNFDRVLLIPPELSEVFPKSRLDEFGIITSASKAHRVPQMVTLIGTIPESARGGPLSLAFSTKEDFRGADERTLVIDLSWMNSMYPERGSGVR